jgi:UDP-N-acetylmuramoyl-tripeptide--D-alanyl-D-alanine ligase
VTVPFSPTDAAGWTGGELRRGGPDRHFAGVSIDSRSVQPGELFVAIVGPAHDGHDYLDRALAAGAAGLVIQAGRSAPEGGVPTIAVDDTTRALADLARGHRKNFSGPVVAITGSNGKTTTKEMCAAILSVAAPCLKNAGNLNNEYGLPLTLLRRAESDRSLVVELGMNHRGEIAALADIARPTIGIVTNVGTAHIEHLGSQDEIAREKGDLVAALPDDGVAVLCADDPRVMDQAPRTRARVLRFGLGADADVRAEDVVTRDTVRFAFSLATPEGCTPVEVAGLGEATLRNALAAAAGALAAGARLDDVAPGLAVYQPVAGRLAPRALAGDIWIIDDSYNANPQSLEVALCALAGLERKGRAIAVLGDMGELGDRAADAHRAAGRRVAELGIDHLFAIGEHAQAMADAAIDAGLAPERAHASGDAIETAAPILEMLREGDRILVKGSRSMRMERIVEHLAKGDR